MFSSRFDRSSGDPHFLTHVKPAHLRLAGVAGISRERDREPAACDRRAAIVAYELGRHPPQRAVSHRPLHSTCARPFVVPPPTCPSVSLATSPAAPSPYHCISRPPTAPTHRPPHALCPAGLSLDPCESKDGQLKQSHKLLEENHRDRKRAKEACRGKRHDRVGQNAGLGKHRRARNGRKQRR